MHLPIGLGFSLLSANRLFTSNMCMTLMSSLCETSPAPQRSKSYIDPSFFKMQISSLQAFPLIVEATIFAQLIASPFSYAT
jgi:hypothetical protein